LAGIVLANQAPTPVSLAKASPSSVATQSRTAASPTSAAANALPSTAPESPVSLPNAGASVGPIARITIPKIGIRNAPIYDRSTDSKGNMLIAPGYAITHYSFSAPFGSGNAVIYGHDDIQGSIFSRLYDLVPGDMVQVSVGGQTEAYRVTGHEIVAPTDLAVLNPTSDVRLTIITCWPFNVDTKRWIVTAIKA
jgi:sortase A